MNTCDLTGSISTDLPIVVTHIFTCVVSNVKYTWMYIHNGDPKLEYNIYWFDRKRDWNHDIDIKIINNKLIQFYDDM